MNFWFFWLHQGLFPNGEGAELLTLLKLLGKTCTVAADSSSPKASFLGRVGWQLFINFCIVALLFLYRSVSFVPVLNTPVSVWVLVFFSLLSFNLYLISFKIPLVSLGLLLLNPVPLTFTLPVLCTCYRAPANLAANPWALQRKQLSRPDTFCLMPWTYPRVPRHYSVFRTTCCYANDSFLFFLLPPQSYVHPTSQQALA